MFNIQQFYVLPTQCIYVFLWNSEQTATFALHSINWFVFYNRDGKCLLRGTYWLLINRLCFVRKGLKLSQYMRLSGCISNFMSNTGYFSCKFCLHCQLRTKRKHAINLFSHWFLKQALDVPSLQTSWSSRTYRLPTGARGWKWSLTSVYRNKSYNASSLTPFRFSCKPARCDA
jgi:hypothetical protein